MGKEPARWQWQNCHDSAYMRLVMSMYVLTSRYVRTYMGAAEAVRTDRSGMDSDQEVLAQPAWQDRLTPRDLRALTPLKWLHINPSGTFTLDMHQRLPLDLAA